MKLSHLFVLSAAAVVPAGAMAADPQVDLKTNLGTIRLELNPTAAPKTVENFLQYVKDGHYNGTIFHRVKPEFMIQGGGYRPGLKEKEAKYGEIRNESDNGLKNERGTLAMARKGDPDSASDQFFINVNDNDFLNWGNPRGDGNGYAAFGRVVSGLEVVNKIAKLPTGSGGPMSRDVPKQQVIIESATVVGAK